MKRLAIALALAAGAAGLATTPVSAQWPSYPNSKNIPRTADGKVSAHFEHTVLVTETGVEILTLP